MNYQQEMEKELEKITQQTRKPTLLLHACCAPCSTFCLETLIPYFKMTILFYNPNITETEEYEKRKAELKRFLKEVHKDVAWLDCDHDKASFLTLVKGKEEMKEGSLRCYDCYYLRLSKTAQLAKTQGFDYFTTTLSISPFKNSRWLNEIGASLQQTYQISYLYADFKKKNGYAKSIALAKEYKLYRQDYCGCIYSKIQRDKKKKEQAARQSS